MTAIGTFETCRRAPRMSGVEGRPEVNADAQTDAIDPKRTSGAH